ncbi:MAG: Fpg/Nei family DNA glycosylase [Gammaproteobacteria bacterium]|nr:Fpg/Nei family DNA glycosylase [Gammaproteobacteria bacterium]
MPELPDVEYFKRYLDATALHQRIQRVHVQAPALLRGLSPQALGRRLHHRRLEGTHRHGKYLFARIDSCGWLVLHFGMTGTLSYFADASLLPDYTRLLLDFDNGFHLAYTAPRKLGCIAVVDRPQAVVAEHRLGADAMNLDAESFRALARARRGGVKSWLMNQHVIAGIGNIYADEILFQARVLPQRTVDDLSDRELHRLYTQMRRVLPAAVDAHVDPDEMPEDFLLPCRGARGRCPRCGTELGRAKLSGRTAYYCVRCQR